MFSILQKKVSFSFLHASQGFKFSNSVIFIVGPSFFVLGFSFPLWSIAFRVGSLYPVRLQLPGSATILLRSSVTCVLVFWNSSMHSSWV